MDKNMKIAVMALLAIVAVFVLYTAIAAYRVNKSKMGLSKEQVLAAHIRWNVFEEWAASRPEYRGWDSDTRIFKKAHEEFIRQIRGTGTKVAIVK